MPKKGLTISKVRGVLYAAAKLLGDAQAVSKAGRTGSATPVVKRVARRAAGKLTARFLSSIFKG